MSSFEVIIQCSSCHQRWSVVLEQDTERPQTKVHCRNCKRILFEYAPMAGFVYILSNPGMPGLIKIGMTTSSVAERVRQLDGTGVPGHFVVEAYFASERPRDHERQIHQQLRNVRIEGKEFFRTSPEIAINHLRRIVRREPTSIRPELARRIQQATGRRAPAAPAVDNTVLDQIKILPD